ncbi:MAG TPA: valine--tRNA ligase, partial [Candidatus Saccharimonadales bacterium]
NGNLHIGHALTLGLEDIAVRYRRLKGDQTLFVPGADHAGFETQSVYEKVLAKQGKSRFDFSREALYGQIWDFVAQNRQNFETQYRRLGASVDWKHFTFTLDERVVKRAYATFKKMWDERLIYRGKRLVNFCTFHGTAFADIEVVHKEEKGKLWYIRYPLADGSGEVVVATTRPETMLGDTGVAVHPSDKRYDGLAGKTVRLPLIGREVPIVADDFVDMQYGTGAVKLTPAHDPNDYDAAERHSLPKLTIIDYEGKLNSAVPERYRGLTVQEARKRVAADLEAGGYLVKTEEIVHNVGHCYKCATVIEPLLKDQWFVDMQPLAKPAIAALRAGKITFYPQAKQAQLIGYLEALRDWNISRQIAWGIPIPAFQNVDDPDDWIYDERVEQEIIEVDGKTYHRDPDVFDTWFSSSSWPYATLGYPDSDDFKTFYPLSLMETGGEILYPWVSRMIMLGLYITGTVPFTAVYVHGYVMAEDGAKMSKSLGNVINPIEVIDAYGSDALRMGIVAGRVPAVNRGYDPRRVEEARNFCNKLWNVARYIESVTGQEHAAGQGAEKPEPRSPADHWILSRLGQAADAIAAHLDKYRFAEGYEMLYHFVWDDFADWYVEASKAQPNEGLLKYCLEATLTIAHPFAPFLTETIWQTLGNTEEVTTLATHRWPEVPRANAAAVKDFEAVQDVITETRYIITALKVKGVTLYHTGEPVLQANAGLIKQLAHLKAVEAVQNGSGLNLTRTKYRCWLDISSETAHAYLSELKTRQEAQKRLTTQLKGRLANKKYVENAPEPIVEQTRQQLAEAQQLMSTLEAEYARFIQV